MTAPPGPARNAIQVTTKMKTRSRIANHAQKERTTKSKVPRVIRSVGNVHKGDTRPPRASQTLLIATRVPPGRVTRTTARRAALRASTVVPTPKQRKQVRPHVPHVVWVETPRQEVRNVPIAQTAEQRVVKVNLSIVLIAKPDFMLPLVMILAVYARLVSIRIKA